ncbi:MAG: ATP-binding protein [Opitutaceae bacterium]|jgi:ATP-dependent 26S proteasome regulatory subunit|nr:ATP-binding protein [Opitutaceae bacterium]
MPLPGNPIDAKNSLFASGNVPKATPGPEAAPSGETPRQESRTEKGKPVMFVSRKPLYTFEQVILPDDVRAQFDVLKSRIKNHKLLYEEWGLDKIDPQGRHVAFNLYGVPGTGKTMCVEATAAELRKEIIEISYAEIESKYVGETGKNIAAAFKTASETGALLFFDEADSILGRRMTSVTQAADHGVNVARAVMLKQLDNFDGIVAFATNLAKNFDNAFVRRISQHIEIPLPNDAGRAAIWKKMVSPKIPGHDRLDWERLVLASKGFSGGDIKNAIVNSLARLANYAGNQRLASTDIFITEIQHVANAKKNVGADRDIKITETIVPNFSEPAQLDKQK